MISVNIDKKINELYVAVCDEIKEKAIDEFMSGDEFEKEVANFMRECPSCLEIDFYDGELIMLVSVNEPRGEIRRGLESELIEIVECIDEFDDDYLENILKSMEKIREATESLILAAKKQININKKQA